MKALVVFLFALLTWAFTCSPCLAQAGFKAGKADFEQMTDEEFQQFLDRSSI